MISSEIWQLYSQNKQTVAELAAHFSVSDSTIKRRLRAVKEVFECVSMPSGGIILMDTTYFGRNWGVTVLMDSATGMKLWRKYI
ncbi:MAG: transcriptional regulator [Bacteroidales bacterium]|nr:transcriptional regulator [Bacteroidales bacterium]